MEDYQNEEKTLDERVIDIARVAKVVKGGRRFSFRVTVVVGDNNGRVGLGIGKAGAGPDAMLKASDHAKQNMHDVSLLGTTIAHEVIGSQSGAKVLLKPASPGTGVIAAGGVRAVCESAGIKDILTKSMGSENRINIAKATIRALGGLKDPREVVARRKGIAASAPAAEAAPPAQAAAVNEGNK